MLLSMLANATSISQGEIAQEISNRNYTTGEAPTAPSPTAISRSDAIKAAVNRGLDAAGLARRAPSLTYLDVMRMSNLISYCTTWANWYLQGTQTPSSSLLSGLRGSIMRLNVRGSNGLGLMYPPTTVPPPAQPGVSGWWMLLSLLGQGLITYAQYEMTKGYMTSQGYSFPQTTGGTYQTYRQELLRINPNLTEAEISRILAPYAPAKPESQVPTWVWIGAGLGVVYMLTQKKA